MTINRLVSITIVCKMLWVVLMQEYMNTAGATPNETISDSESIFFPKPILSCLLIFRATQPSVESNMIAIIIKIAESSKLLFIEHIMDKNPELIFNNEIKSDIAKKLPILVFNLLIFLTPVLLLYSLLIK